MKYLKTLHAEENAILFAKRDLDKRNLRLTSLPKLRSENHPNRYFLLFTAQSKSEDFLRWGDKIKVSQDMFEQAGVQADWLPLADLD